MTLAEPISPRGLNPHITPARTIREYEVKRVAIYNDWRERKRQKIYAAMNTRSLVELGASLKTTKEENR